MPPDAPFTAIVLAAQRAGALDPFAAAASVPNKCLVPIGGAPLIRHVVGALRAHPSLSRLRIVVEPETAPLTAAALGERGAAAEFVDAADNLADSVYRATEGVSQPMLVTTADNVMLTRDAVTRILRAVAGGADAALGLATQRSVMAAHPDGQRRLYRFSDDAYSNCNLYAFAGPQATAAVESFRSGGQFAKKPLRLIAAVGPINLALLLLHRLSLTDAMGRMSRKLGLRIVPVVLADGALAIDVDNARTFKVASELLARRA